MLAETKPTSSAQPLTVKDGLPRLFELIVVLAGGIIFMPLLALSAAAVALTSRGSVLFRQERVGRYGRIFTFYKLRTMKVASNGPQVTMSNDARVTAIGKWLRKTKLDELPALWNVLKGDMSLVGPRPEVPRYVDLEDRMWQTVLEAKPGITDPVTLRLRNEEELLASTSGDPEEFYLQTLQPLKLKGYVDYLQKRSWRSDLWVLWSSLVAVILPFEAPPPKVNEGVRKDSGLPYPFAGLRSKQGQYLFDFSVLILAFTFSYLLRYEFLIPKEELPHALVQVVFVVLLQYFTLYLTGVHKFIWRYIGMAEVGAFIKAALLSFVPLMALRITLPQELQAGRVPISIIFMDTFLAFTGVLVLRVLRRSLYERYERRNIDTQGVSGRKRSVLLIGAGRAGVMVVKEIKNRGDMDLEVKGFVDDDPEKQGAIINRVEVLGTTQDLPQLVSSLEIDHVIISLAQASRQQLQQIIRTCEQIPVKVRIIPGLYEILQGKVGINRIRDVQIEDFLGREPAQLDIESISQKLTGKAIMVTGAGGSIGSELARQIAHFRPASLLMVERCEGALFNIHREMAEAWPELNITPLLADVCDEVRMRSILAATSPQVILHAAAHKHVPMMEYHPVEAIKNNVLATQALGKIAGEFEVEVFVLISTDKAVRPTSVMGASKRVAELVVQDLNHQFKDTQYLAVRFGNVIGSTGSVIPIFHEQIRRGGPVTVTHPDMERYFMTIPEAAQLVLQASAMGEGGEILILDMGKPVRILDLAKDFIRLSGLKPEDDIKIIFTGVRPGEKLTEELQIPGEQIPTRHPKIFINRITPACSGKEMRHALHRLSDLCAEGEGQEIRRFFNWLLPEAQLEIAREASLPESRSTSSDEFLDAQPHWSKAAGAAREG